MCHAILIHQSWTKVLGTALQYSYFSVISRCPHKTVHPFWNFLAVLPLPTLYKVETPKKIMDAHVQHCLWDEGRGWTRVNWKMTQKCNVSQDFCPAGLYFKCFSKKRFTNASCCSVIILTKGQWNIINSFSGIIMDVKLLVSQSQLLSTGALFKE